MNRDIYRRWLDEEIERERGNAYVARQQAAAAVDAAIRQRVRVYDRLNDLIDARWGACPCRTWG